MLIVLFFILAGLFIAIYTIINDWKNHDIPLEEMGIIGETRESTIGYKIWMCIWRPFFSILLGMFVGTLLAMAIGTFIPKKNIVKETAQIYSANDFFGTNGHFFLGIGSIEAKPYYFFYKKTNEGLMLDKISTEKTTIIEQDSVLPRIEYLEKEFVNKNNLLWGIPSNDENFRIIIPKNSIRQNFNFDLQ